MIYVKTHVVARGGRSAEEHLVAALRCLYRRAVDDGLITEAGNPAQKVAKPRRLPTTRRALPDTRLSEVNQIAATTGDDPELDTLLLRLHTETACRRGGALALRPRDLDSEQCLVLLREKGETVRWRPVSPTLMARLVELRRSRAPSATSSPASSASSGHNTPKTRPPNRDDTSHGLSPKLRRRHVNAAEMPIYQARFANRFR